MKKSSDVEPAYEVTWRNNNVKGCFNVGSKRCNNIMSDNSEHDKSTETTHLVTVHIASNAPILCASSLTSLLYAEVGCTEINVILTWTSNSSHC